MTLFGENSVPLLSAVLIIVGLSKNVTLANNEGRLYIQTKKKCFSNKPVKYEVKKNVAKTSAEVQSFRLFSVLSFRVDLYRQFGRKNMGKYSNQL